MIREKKEFNLSPAELSKILNANSYTNANEEFRFSEISSLSDYKENSLSFYTKNNFTKIKNLIREKNLKVLILPLEYEEQELPSTCSYIFVENVMEEIVKFLDLYYPYTKVEPFICNTAKIHNSVKVGENVSIGSYTVIEKNAVIGTNTQIMSHACIYPFVKIGNNTVIHSHAVLREYTEIGNNCVIQNGVVIGGDGFGYIPHKERVIANVPQVGIVKIEDNVDVGANTCIDRGAVGNTKIGAFTKIDNLVQVGHNVSVGNASFLCGQAGIAGSVEIGNQVTIGGKVGVADHISIPDKSRVAGGSMVTKKLRESGDYIGNPAMPAQKFKKQLFYFRRLEKLFKK